MKAAPTAPTFAGCRCARRRPRSEGQALIDGRGWRRQSRPASRTNGCSPPHRQTPRRWRSARPAASNRRALYRGVAQPLIIAEVTADKSQLRTQLPRPRTPVCRREPRTPSPRRTPPAPRRRPRRWACRATTGRATARPRHGSRRAWAEGWWLGWPSEVVDGSVTYRNSR